MEDDQRRALLGQLIWQYSRITPEEQSTKERFLVKYFHILAHHRRDTGIRNGIKVKLTPKHDELVFAQKLLTPMNLKDKMMVVFALQQEYGISTTSFICKYLTPVFAERKPNGTFRLPVNLRRINHPIKHHYDEQNHPITTNVDVAQHMAGKKYFRKPDCSEACNSLETSDEHSIAVIATQLWSWNLCLLETQSKLELVVIRNKQLFTRMPWPYSRSARTCPVLRRNRHSRAHHRRVSWKRWNCLSPQWIRQLSKNQGTNVRLINI